MCDYCSCRSVPAIEALSADHEALAQLGDVVRRRIAVGDHGAADVAFARLVRLMRHHTELEEATVFAALRSAGEMGEHVDALVVDHRAMQDAVDHLDGDAWDADVLRLLDDLDEHMAREEYDLFPATLLALGPREWAIVQDRSGPVSGHAA